MHPSRHFVCAIDFSECSSYALEWMVRNFILQPTLDTLTLVTVITPPTDPADYRHSMRMEFDEQHAELQALQQLQHLWQVTHAKCLGGSPSPKVNFRVDVGQPGTVLVQLVARLQPTMIIMGSHGKMGKARELGSVSDYCIRHASVPVIVIREPAGSSTRT